MSISLMPFFWVALAFPILWFLQRWIHSHLQGLSLLLTGKPDLALVIYALVLLPGVLLHELSHWFTARMLGVRTGTFSLIPKKKGNDIVLGYVEVYKGRNLGPIRESLIGGAPLITGTVAILIVSYFIFGVGNITTAVQSGDLDLMTISAENFFATDDVLVWLYLLFAISNAMMPSPSDRRAWPAFLWLMFVVGVILYLFGFIDNIWDGIAQPASIVFGYLGTALTIAIAVDAFFMIFIALFEGIISRVRGLSVDYGRKVSM